MSCFWELRFRLNICDPLNLSDPLNWLACIFIDFYYVSYKCIHCKNVEFSDENWFDWIVYLLSMNIFYFMCMAMYIKDYTYLYIYLSLKWNDKHNSRMDRILKLISTEYFCYYYIDQTLYEKFYNQDLSADG